jgi:hypothetical protein
MNLIDLTARQDEPAVRKVLELSHGSTRALQEACDHYRSFQPSCKSGACGGKFVHYYVSVNGEFHATNHGTFKKGEREYLAQIVAGSMSWCQASGKKVLSKRDSAQYEIHSTAATTDKNGQWVATKISGTDTEYYPFGSGCLPGHLKVKFEGSIHA